MNAFSEGVAELEFLVAPVGRLTLLLAVAWCVAALARKASPRWRIVIWRATAVALLVLAVTSFLEPRLAWRVLPTATPRVSVAVPVEAAGPPVGILAPPTRLQGFGAATAARTAPSALSESTDRKPTRETPRPPAPPLAAASIALAVWLAGVAIGLLRITAVWWTVRRIIGRAQQASPDLIATAEQVAERLRVNGPLGVRVSDATIAPCSAGFFRLTVLLPAGMQANDDPPGVHAALAHELAHLAGRDLAWNAFLEVIVAACWFHPLAWRIRLAHADACDERCDAVATGVTNDIDGYAQLLARVALAVVDRPPSAVLPMARTPRVLRRIRLLPTGKGRVPISWRRAAVAGAVFAVAAAVLGTTTLEQRTVNAAEAPVKDEPASSASTDDGADPASMRLEFVDEAGEPLPGVKVFANRVRPQGVEGERIVNTNHESDETGLVRLPIDRQSDGARLWVGKPGYVGEFVSLHRAIGEESESLPATYQFELAGATKIGGVVVDADGAPIAGVKVILDVNAPTRDPLTRESVNAIPRLDNRLSNGNTGPAIRTDEEGRWSVDNAPRAPASGEDYSFSIKLEHADYLSGESLGDVMRGQGVTVAELRSRQAVFSLERGLRVTGTVTDTNGDPITKGWVVWSDEPYFFGGTWQSAIGPDGRFSTASLEKGEHPVTIVAPGFGAQRRLVKIDDEPIDLKFELEPGRRIEIRFVDLSGAPIPDARVRIANTSMPDAWQGSNALHNHRSSNVPDYGIPDRADANGVYVWDWAPNGAVTYRIGAKGYAAQRLSLIPKSEPHIVTLHESRVAAGLVTDARTGEQVAKFQAMPVIVFRPDFYSTQYSGAKQGVDGRYELPLVGSGNADDRYRVRFEAEGYRSFISDESFGPQDGRVELNAQLEPAPARAGLVVDATGTPVANATIIEGTPTWAPRVRNSEPESYGERVVQSDKQGRFQLAATVEPVRVRVLHAAGVAERLVQPDETEIGTMRLEPWASISGWLIQEGKPVAEQSVYFHPFADFGLGEARFQDSHSARTNAYGRFQMDRLPPVPGCLRVYLGPWEDSPLTSGESLPLRLEPGERREIVLGGEGAIVTGRVLATGRDEAPLDRRWSLNYLIRRDGGIEPPYPDGYKAPAFDPTGPFQAVWLLDPSWESWSSTRERHFVKLSSDGDLRVSGVGPGEYDLVLRLYEQPAGCLVETVGERVLPITVPESGVVELGDIEVPCRAGPRPGSDMRAYEFVDASGRRQQINDLLGRHVVMHVWASWCAPCLATMPEVMAAAERFDAADVVFVGLNVDADRDAAKAFADRRGWSWAQNYLGDDSDLVRQLAISSVPVYYLVGPDGKLVTADSDWSQIAEQLAALEPKLSMAP